MKRLVVVVLLAVMALGFAPGAIAENTEGYGLFLPEPLVPEETALKQEVDIITQTEALKELVVFEMFRIMRNGGVIKETCFDEYGSVRQETCKIYL